MTSVKGHKRALTVRIKGHYAILSTGLKLTLHYQLFSYIGVPFEGILNAASVFCDILLFMIKTVSIATITPDKVRLSTTDSPVTALSVMEFIISHVTLTHVH